MQNRPPRARPTSQPVPNAVNRRTKKVRQRTHQIGLSVSAMTPRTTWKMAGG